MTELQNIFLDLNNIFPDFKYISGIEKYIVEKDFCILKIYTYSDFKKISGFE